MSGFEYTIKPNPLRRFKSTLEMRWFRYLKPRVSYVSYEYLAVTPRTPGWTWNDSNPHSRYISDFFVKLSSDPDSRYVAEVKPITDLEEFDDYLPKPVRTDYHLCLLGVGSQDGKSLKSGAPGPIWRWENRGPRSRGWAPWEPFS